MKADDTVTEAGRAVTSIMVLLHSEGLRRAILLTPALIYLGIFFIYPLVRLLSMSLFDPHFTLEHYSKALTVPVYARILFRTFEISTIVTFFCLVLGYPVAALIAQATSRIRTRLLFLILIPFWTSILVRTYAWMVTLQRQGLVNELLKNIGAIEEPLTLLFNRFSVVLGMTHVLLPFMIFPLFAVMVSIDQGLIKAAKSMGASPFQAFLKVFLPLSFPGVAAGCLLVLILGLGFFITPALIGGSGEVMLAGLIERQVSTLLNWGFASTLSVMLLAATLVMFGIAAKWLGINRIWGGIR